MNRIAKNFYYGWWLVAIALIFIAIVVCSWLFLDLLIMVIWLLKLIQILISIIFGIGAVIIILYLLFSSGDM